MNIEFEDILDVDDKLVEQIRQWRNSKKVSKYMYTNHYISKEEHQKWIEKLRKKDTTKTWIIKYNNRPVGLVSLSDIDYKNKTTNWGFYIADETLRGKGIGSVTLKKLMNLVFEEMDFNKMQTIVIENNTIAIRLYKKLGFKIDDTHKMQLERDGKKIDVIKMWISKEDWNVVKEKNNFLRTAEFI